MSLSNFVFMCLAASCLAARYNESVNFVFLCLAARYNESVQLCVHVFGTL